MIPNNLPSPDDFTHEIGALEIDLKNFQGAEITADNAPALRDVIARGQAIAKKVEGARKEAKQPHMDAAKAVDTSFKPVGERVGEIIDAAKKALQAFLIAEQERERKAAEEARRKAEEAREFSDVVADDPEIAERARQWAEAQAKRAKEQEDAAEGAGRIGSQSGLARAAALRTYRFAEVTDAAALVAHYANHPDVIEAATKLANADIRAAKGADISIPGVCIAEEQRVA